MFQVSLTSRALGMHQKLVLSEDEKPTPRGPTVKSRLNEMIERYEGELAEGATELLAEDSIPPGGIKPGSIPPGSVKIKPGQYAPKSMAKMIEMAEAVALDEKKIDWDAVQKILEDGLKPLQNLGSATGKHGTYFGIKGNSMKIRVGRRELALDVWSPTWRHGKVAGTWGNEDYELLSKVTPEKVKEFVDKVKASPTTKELRAKARKEGEPKYDSPWG